MLFRIYCRIQCPSFVWYSINVSTSHKVLVAYRYMLSVRSTGGYVGDASSPPVIFNTVFNEYYFFIILNLFSYKPYALSTHKSKMFKQKYIIFGETHQN